VSDPVSITFEGDKALLARLAGLSPERTLDALEGGLLAGANLFANAWKEAAPYRTGTYRRSIHVETAERAGENVQVKVGTDQTDPPYPFYLEYGTSGYYPIVPKNRPGALWWLGLDHPVAMVWHPGIAPHPSMRPALDENREAIIEEVHKAVEQLVNG
jgi:HK97 gp10 family phage protein